MSLKDSVAFADNPDPRCACVLLIDTSYSMRGQPIDLLNEGLEIFAAEVKKDELSQRRTEIAIVSFGCNGVQLLAHDKGEFIDVQTISETSEYFVTASDFRAPRLVASGNTPMGTAMARGLELIRARKAVYDENGIPSYRPWMFLLTDGAPTDEWQLPARLVQDEDRRGGLVWYVVGVPPNVQKDTLTQVTGPASQPLMLDDMKFAEMFKWLSRSQHLVSHSTPGQQIPLLPVEPWALA